MPQSRMKLRRAVSLRDIAEELDLSISMVSKVLNGRMGTSGGLPETVRAIRDKAREMGYQKNLQAQALRTGRVNVIAVCIHHHGERGSLIVEAMVEGIAREAALQQQRLVLHYYSTLEELQHIWNDFSRSAVDGVILGGLPHIDWLHQVSDAAEAGFHVVTILQTEVAGGCINIGMSEREIGRQATRHLIEQGCRQLAHFGVCGSDGGMDLGLLRTEGYKQALIEAGLPVRHELIIPIEHFSFTCGIQATQQLLNSGVEFDGIVTQSDHHAAGALNILLAHGINVPRQVKLIGVDDSPFCEMASVPLSSVSQEFQIRGRTAVKTLMRKIEGESVSSINVAPVLGVRQSSSHF